MTFRNILTRWTVLLSVFALLLAGGLARAQRAPKKQPAAEGNQNERKEAKSGKHHETGKDEGPIVDNWEIVGGRGPKAAHFGEANLTLDPNGTWNYSGHLNQQYITGETDARVRCYILIGVKSAEGTSVAFRQSMVVDRQNPESYSWQKQGHNPIIRTNFKSFKKDHDWASQWECISLGQGNAGGGGGKNDPNWGSIIGEVGGTLATVLGLIL